MLNTYELTVVSRFLSFLLVVFLCSYVQLSNRLSQPPVWLVLFDFNKPFETFVQVSEKFLIGLENVSLCGGQC